MPDQTELLTLLPHSFQSTHLLLPEKQSGKVRDWYVLPGGRRLIITTDRLSAFDRVLGCVPYKGQVLNQLTSWWMQRTRDILPNHLVSEPDPNAVVARELRPLQVEVVVRGFITGVTSTALWHRYALGEREIYGYRFPEGLKKNQELPQPILTPTTKGGPTGHDERLTCTEVVERGLVDAAIWEQVQSQALALFRRGQAIARRAGLILVDTKYEFGLDEAGVVTLMDEVHTPDSSRFWLAETYGERFEHGEEPENFDKEFIRLEFARKGYRGEGEPPVMPESLWVAASQRYIAIYEKLTGEPFVAGAYPVEPRLVENLRRAGILPESGREDWR